MPITLLDGILVGFTLVSAMLAMVRGFSREVLSVASWIAAAADGYFFYPAVLPYIKPHIDNEKIAMAASAAIVFFIALIVVTVITMKLADFIIDSRIGALDRTLVGEYLHAVHQRYDPVGLVGDQSCQRPVVVGNDAFKQLGRAADA